MNDLKKLFLSFAVLFLVLLSGKAQDQKWSSATGINFAFPVEDMGDVYNFGWGIYGDIDYNFNKILAARLDIGWNQFSGDDIIDPVTGFPEEVRQSVWEFTGGLRAKVAFLYAEFKGRVFYRS